MTLDKSILLSYKTMRKCNHCKEYIVFEDDYDSVVYYMDNVYHINCLKKKLFSMKSKKMTEEKFNQILLDDLDDSRNNIEDMVYKNHLYKYLMSKYELIMVNNSIYTKF